MVLYLYVCIYLQLHVQQLLLTAHSNLPRDYDSVAASSESIKSARLSACRIDGSYELLAGEESNIGRARIEDLQQK